MQNGLRWVRRRPVAACREAGWQGRRERCAVPQPSAHACPSREGHPVKCFERPSGHRPPTCTHLNREHHDWEAQQVEERQGREGN